MSPGAGSYGPSALVPVRQDPEGDLAGLGSCLAWRSRTSLMVRVGRRWDRVSGAEGWPHSLLPSVEPYVPCRAAHITPGGPAGLIKGQPSQTKLEKPRGKK